MLFAVSVYMLNVTQLYIPCEVSISREAPQAAEQHETGS